MPSVETRSSAETVELGARLGLILAPGDFIALEGELGAGKTQLAKGIARGLEVDPDTPVTSPTYTILNIYEGRIPLYHFDLYRLNGPEDIENLGFDEYFSGRGVCVVEWAERLEGDMPEDFLTVNLSHAGGDERSVSFEATGARAEAILRELVAGLNTPSNAGL